MYLGSYAVISFESACSCERRGVNTRLGTCVMLDAVLFRSRKSTDSRIKYRLLNDGLAFLRGLVDGVAEPRRDLLSAVGGLLRHLRQSHPQSERHLHLYITHQPKIKWIFSSPDASHASFSTKPEPLRYATPSSDHLIHKTP